MSFMSISSQSSGASGGCSNTSHWSTPAPLTPHLFADADENPLPTTSASAFEETGTQEVLVDDHSATPTRKSVAADRVSRIHTQDATISSSSSSMSSIDTPPSLHSYSSALRITMRQRYDEAFRRMNQEGNKVVMDFSWEDEDPIDRHVKLVKAKAEWAAKRKAEESKATCSTSRPNIRPLSGESKYENGLPNGSMLGRPTAANSSLDEGLPPARPALLDFRGFSHLTTSDSGSPGAGTPGSVCSTGSFEGGSSEDWYDLYGRSKSTESLNPRTLPMDSPSIINRMSQATISSEASGSTVRPTSTATTVSFFAQGLTVTHTPNSSYAQPQSSTPSMFQPLPTPAPSSAMASGYFAIPTKSAPVAVSRTYPERPSMGVRQKSRNHPYANANGRPDSRIDRTPDEGDFTGRTESETMILRAGLRSQRSRAVTRV